MSLEINRGSGVPAADFGTMSDKADDPALVMQAVLAAEQGWEMVIRLGQSLELTDGLRELAFVAVEAGRAHDQMAAADIADGSPAGLRLSHQRREQVRAAADLFKEAMDSQWELLDKAALADTDPALMLADPFGALRSVVDLDAMIRVLRDQFMSSAAPMSADEALYLHAYLQAAVREDRVPLLLRALFVTAVSMVEPIVRRMVQLLIYRAESDRFDSLADPKLDREVRERTYGGPGRWREAFNDLGVAIPDEVIDWERLSELWEDRNIFAHRGGVADQRHSRRRGTTAGMALPIELSAVQLAIDDIGAIRFGLVGATWAHLYPEAAEVVGHAAGGPAIDALRADRPNAAVRLARIEKAFVSGPDDIARAQVALWLAVEACDGTDAIRQEVTEWDASALGAEFELARHILTHDYDSVLNQLPALIDAGVIQLDQVRDWPLFENIRKEGLLDHLLFDRKWL
jgi:hypothetical protein